LADALSWVALDLWFVGESAAATTFLDEGLRLGRAAGEGDSVAMSLRNLGVIARSQGHYPRAAARFQEAAAEARSLGWSRGYPYTRAVAHLGRVRYLQGNCQSASRLLKQALGCVREADLAGHTLADCLDWLAAVEGALGRPTRAAQLFGAAEAQWRASGAVRYAPERAAYERDLVAVRAVLPQAVFAAAWARGRSLSHHEAIAYALAADEPAPSGARV
jgi:tetratricopeptide (TPR) repeat protein